MTVAELIRELETFQPDSELLIAMEVPPTGWTHGPAAVVYWDTDAKKVVIEAEAV